jgi:hypothetical protein
VRPLTVSLEDAIIDNIVSRLEERRQRDMNKLVRSTPDNIRDIGILVGQIRATEEAISDVKSGFTFKNQEER